MRRVPKILLLAAAGVLGAPLGTVAWALPQDTHASDAEVSAIVGKPVKCTDHKIAIFTCHNVEVLSFLPRSAIGVEDDDAIVTAMWGWIDSTNKREYAIVGHTNGTSFVDVTDPVNPKYLGILPYTDDANPSKWRDMRVYRGYAYIVSDNAGPHGMQVFDLAQLAKVTQAPVTFQATAVYDQVESSHTIAVNEKSGFLFIAGANGGGETCGGGLHMIDVRKPATPVFAGCYSEESIAGMNGPGYIHETQCVTYHGPDPRYKDREICLNASGAAVGISDVTDKAAPKTLSTASYPDAAYAHQGWFTEDQRYFFVNDELDELRQVQRGDTAVRSRTILFDLKDVEDPVVVKDFFGPSSATDHNFFIRGRYMYQSHNATGYRIYDVQDPTQLKEVGYLDTYPSGDEAGFVGSWGNFPYFSNDVAGVTSRDQGLFLVRLMSH